MKYTAAMFALLAIVSIMTLSNIYAEGYQYVHDITPILTFRFTDDIEVHEFPIFIMENNFVQNNESPRFSIQGILKDAPNLHKALDTAFEHQYSFTSQWNYKHVDVEVDFMQNATSIKTLKYVKCQILNYNVITLNDDYESYLSSKSGFVIVDNIEFLCDGLTILSPLESKSDPNKVITHHTSFDYYNDIRTIVEFEFDYGIERIEFPYFELISGYEQSTQNIIPSFSIEGMMGNYPLLYQAVDNAHAVMGLPIYSNIDFNSKVEFVRNGTILRALDFKDCRVSSYKIMTLFDKEEGFTNKSGFALVEQIEFECSGLSGKNPRYSDVYGDGLTGQTTYLSYDSVNFNYTSLADLSASVTFYYDYGKETTVFPIYKQDRVLGPTSTGTLGVFTPPTFELTGQISDLPMLYDLVDQSLDFSKITGRNIFLEQFDIDIAFVKDVGQSAQLIRGFKYSDCQSVDYIIKTQQDREESYFKGFVHSNTFVFECLGYDPYIPMSDYNTHQKSLSWRD